jgi:hypothetical protein
MIDRTPFAARLAAAIEAYADAAPTDVDPLAMTRFVAAGSPRFGSSWLGGIAGANRIAFLLLLGALLASIVVGAVAVGGFTDRSGPEDVLTERAFVEPFVGLPPIGAPPTDPSVTALVEHLAWRRIDGRYFYGGMFMYADGRLIWNHYGHVYKGFQEQRLTDEGMRMVQALAIRSAEDDFTGRVKWLDLQGLPAHAWADATIRPYVPNGFAACIAASVTNGVWGEPPRPLPTITLAEQLALLPPAASDLMRARPFVVATWASGPTAVVDEDKPNPHMYETCYELTVDDARRVDAAFRGAGLDQDRDRNRTMLEYHIDLGLHGDDAWALQVWFEPILPDGTFTCSGCG